jgi:hypothetical protein
MGFILIPIWIGWTVVNGMVADKKGYSVGWCMAGSLVFSPFLVYLYLLAIPKQEESVS